MKKLSIQEIKDEEIDMLKIICEFFEQHNLRYYLFAGTLLGAVRHNDFIPWDDDIDLAMERDEYEKLLNILKQMNNKITEEIEFIGFELNNGVFPFIKAVNHLINIEEQDKTDKNLWIDIFPLDYVPNKNLKIYKYKLRLLRKIYFFTRNKVINRSYKFEKYKIKNKIEDIFFRLVTYIYIQQCSKFKNINCNYITNNIWGAKNEPIIEKSILIRNKIFKFNKLFLNGFEDFDIWLTLRYGDYMKLPPENERVTHNFVAWKEEKNEK